MCDSVKLEKDMWFVRTLRLPVLSSAEREDAAEPGACVPGRLRLARRLAGPRPFPRAYDANSMQAHSPILLRVVFTVRLPEKQAAPFLLLG